MLVATVYVIMAFGVFLAAMLEGDRWYQCVIGGIVWPVTLGYILYNRMTGR